MMTTPTLAGGRDLERGVPQERGAVTMWMIFLTTATLLVAGLVIDGGYSLSARRESARLAEQAARVAADQLDVDSIRTGGSDLRASAARNAAVRYLAVAGVRGTAVVDGETVTVTVTQRSKSVILNAFGGPSGYTVSADASATSIDDNDANP